MPPSFQYNAIESKRSPSHTGFAAPYRSRMSASAPPSPAGAIGVQDAAGRCASEMTKGSTHRNSRQHEAAAIGNDYKGISRDVKAPAKGNEHGLLKGDTLQGISHQMGESSQLDEQEGQPNASVDAFEPPRRNVRRAATSSPLPFELMASVHSTLPFENGRSSRSQLSTEILPAPPQLPHDPTYPPLDPTAPYVPGGGLMQPTSGLNGTAVGHQDKKRKQPVYSLAKPSGYEGNVPYALYAIVHGLPEAVTKSKGNKKKRTRATKETATNGRASRSGTPGEAPGNALEQPVADADSAASQLPSGHRLPSEISTETRLASATATPRLATTTLLTTDEPDTGPINHDESASSAVAQPRSEQYVVGSVDVVDPSGVAATSPEDNNSTSFPSLSSHPAMEAGYAAPALAETHGEHDARGDAGLPSVLSQQLKMISAKRGRPSKITLKCRQNKFGALEKSCRGGDKMASSVTHSEASSAQSAQIALAATSSSSTPAPESPLPPFEGDITASIAETSSPIPGLRPTRAAAAKVAARGSYYDASTYQQQTPAQAATIYGLGVQSASDVLARGARRGRKSVPVASGSSLTPYVKNKGRDNGTASKDGTPAVVLSVNDSDDAAEDIPANDEFCSTCFGVGHFICCDSCPRSFHFACVDPPLHINEVPLGDNQAWHCRSCSALRCPPRKLTKADGIFGPLVHYVEACNPSVFTLPLEVKNYFRNVATEPDGSFQDASKMRHVKADKRGIIEERDPFRLRDVKGKEILCYKCGESALPRSTALREAEFYLGASTSETSGNMRNAHSSLLAIAPDGRIQDTTAWRRIISCDYCSLHWHLDCVDPPMAGMPSNFRKWKCPCHIEDLLARTRTPKSSTQVQIIDLPVPTVRNTGLSPGQFYRPRVVNSGQVDIIPDPLDTYWSSNTSTDTSGRSLQRGWTNLDIPQADAQIPGGGMRKIRFRLPEKIVRTDWWLKVLDGGLDRLHDANAAARAKAASMSRLDFLASIAEQRLAAAGDVSIEHLVRVALNTSVPPSVRLQPRSEHEMCVGPPKVRCLPNGGVLKKEENSELPESSIRGSLATLTTEDLDPPPIHLSVYPAGPAKRSYSRGSGNESDLTDLDELEADAAKISSCSAISLTKRRKFSYSTADLDRDDVQSLLAVRELLRRKGEKELIAFLGQ